MRFAIPSRAVMSPLESVPADCDFASCSWLFALYFLQGPPCPSSGYHSYIYAIHLHSANKWGLFPKLVLRLIRTIVSFCRKTRGTWYWNVFPKNGVDCFTITLKNYSEVDHPHHPPPPPLQIDPRCTEQQLRQNETLDWVINFLLLDHFAASLLKRFWPKGQK